MFHDLLTPPSCISVVQNIRPAMTHSMADRTKEEIKKCKNFLETLIRLSSQQPQQTLDNVKKLIQGLLVSVNCLLFFIATIHIYTQSTPASK